MNRHRIISRRGFIGTAAASATALWVPGAFAEELMQTPRQTEGPFYPDKLPLDTDNDLLLINDSIKPAVGEVTHLTGRILSPAGEPVRNAAVEIWQCDASGAYLHSRSDNRARLDANFQGFGRFLTDSRGQYYFRTIKPVPYTFRTAHIHFAVNKGGKRLMSTQMYVKGHELNARDGILQSVRNAKQREMLLAEFKPMKDSRVGELTANFDIVLGHTPEG